MAYRCMNTGLKLKVRADIRAQRRSTEKVANGQRWEFVRGMYGNIYEVIDLERFRWYRQDRAIDGQGDLFDGYLPLMCDYCKKIVDYVERIHYQACIGILLDPSSPMPNGKEIWLKLVTVPVKPVTTVQCRYLKV